MIVYISGPYRAATEWGVQQNIDKARAAHGEVLKTGYMSICPHLNTGGMAGSATDAQLMTGYLEIIRRCCDAILMLDGWRESEGSKIEHECAQAHNLVKFYGVEQFKEWTKSHPK